MYLFNKNKNQNGLRNSSDAKFLKKQYHFCFFKFRSIRLVNFRDWKKRKGELQDPMLYYTINLVQPKPLLMTAKKI